jgi:transposase
MEPMYYIGLDVHKRTISYCVKGGSGAIHSGGSLPGHDQLLVERVERLMSIPAVGPVTALTWALEVGDVRRFSSIKKAISYCGLCGAEKSSGNTVLRTPLSKQRNKHLPTTLIEAAKMAPRYSPTLALLYDCEKQKGNANRATLAVAR